MKNLICLIPVALLIACTAPKTSETTEESVSKHDTTVVKIESIHLDSAEKEILRNSKIAARLATDSKGDFKSFVAFEKSLDPKDLYAVPELRSYVDTFLSLSDKDSNDSVYLYYASFFAKASSLFSNALYATYPTLMQKIQEEKIDDSTKTLISYYRLFDLEFYQTEGTNYLDSRPEYFVTIFKDKVSHGLNEYLAIRAQEMKEGFSEDAGLTISFHQLYKRIVRLDTWLSDYPNCILKDEAEGYFEIYLNTLLTGMDNSVVFENEELVPEVKTILDSVAHTGSSLRSSKIISGYYTVLEKNNFRHNEESSAYLKNKNLFSMLGVQPPLR